MVRLNKYVFFLLALLIARYDDLPAQEPVLPLPDTSAIRSTVKTSVEEPLDQYQSRGATQSINESSGLENSFDAMLQGRIAGLSLIQNNGQPGAANTLQVRGIHTLAASNDPLYVIDGFPLQHDNELAGSGIVFGPPINALTFLSPEDIASITVLKGGAATAMYGARGSNGVLIVKTKRADTLDAGIEVSISGGLKQPLNAYALASGSAYAEFLNQAEINAGGTAIYASPSHLGSGTDWQDALIRDRTLRQNYYLGVRGGSKRISFLLSANYLDDQGLILGSDLSRINLHSNIDGRFSEKFRLKNSLNFSRIDAQTVSSGASATNQSSGVISGALLYNPLLPERSQENFTSYFNYQVNADGQIEPLLQSHFKQADPMLLAASTDSKYASTRLFNHLHLQYEILPNFGFSASVGIDAIFNDEAVFIPGVLSSNARAEGAASKMQSLNFFNQYLLTYSKSLGAMHQISTMLGFSTEGYQRESLGGNAEGFENELLRFYNLSVGQQKSLQSNFSAWGLQSYLGRLSYTFKEKYRLDLSTRADASSRFYGDLQFFPTATISYDLTRMPGLEASKKLNHFLMFASYGITGNENIPAYAQFTVLDERDAALNGAAINGIQPARLGSTTLEMERTHQLNMGAKSTWLDGQLKVCFDAYFSDTKNALVFEPLSATSGYAIGLRNGAQLTNSGAELMLGYEAETSILDWGVDFSLGFNKNQVKSLNQDPVSRGGSIMGVRAWNLLQAGTPVGNFYGYRSDGLVAPGERAPSFAGLELQSGDQKYKDLNGDGIIDASDKTILGNATPDLNLGLATRISWRALDFSVLFQGLFGHQMANFNRLILENPSGTTNVSQAYLAGSGAAFPVPRRNHDPYFIFSDRQVEDATYLRVKNITLGITLPSATTEKVGMNKCRLYISAQNAATITNYSGINPDVSHFGSLAGSQGVDFGIYPAALSILGGLNIVF